MPSKRLLLCCFSILAVCSAPFANARAAEFYWYGVGDSRNNIALSDTDPVDGSGYQSLYPAETGPNGLTVSGYAPHSVYGEVAANAVSGHSETSNNDLLRGALSLAMRQYQTQVSATNSTAAGNRVNVLGAGTGGSVYGGYASATADSNVVAKATAADSPSSRALASGTATAEARAQAIGNMVTMEESTIGGHVFGGYASAVATADAKASAKAYFVGAPNTATAEAYAYATAEAVASYNEIIVASSSIGGSLFGGYVSVATTTATAVEADGTGSSFPDEDSAEQASGKAQYNTVTLFGEVRLDPLNSGLYGGADSLDNVTVASDYFTGNTLNLNYYNGGQAKEIKNFQYFNFLLPSSVRDGDVVLTAQNITLGDTEGTDSTVQSVYIAHGSEVLQKGEIISLLHSEASLEGRISNDGAVFTEHEHDLVEYELLLSQTAHDILITVKEYNVSPRAKALAEGRLAGLIFLNQGADLLTGQGVRAAQSGGEGITAFGVMQGGSSRYDTGSHVDVNGFSLLAGVALKQDTAWGNLLLGAFFEAGIGHYSTYNSFTNYASVAGDGGTKYSGAGLLGRFDFSAAGSGHAYAEASLRAGGSRTDFSSADIHDNSGVKASYDYNAAYYGLHAGLGYIRNLNADTEIDFYGKYLWSKLENSSVEVFDGRVRFDSVDSHRLRAGLRVSHEIASTEGAHFSPYIGAAYEHEFDGKAGATVYGTRVSAPELEGASGMGELGLYFKTSAARGLSLDLGLQGYLGVREGVTGSLQIKWEF